MKGFITGAALTISTIYGPAQAQMSMQSTMPVDSTTAIVAPMQDASSTAVITAIANASLTEKTKTQFPTNANVMAYVKRKYANQPILIAISSCESGFRQYDDKTGAILHGKVNAEDVGVMQINQKYHLAKAASMGYDLNTVEGNVAYAQYLYDTQGSTPWSASEPCWNNINTALALAAK